MSGKKSALFILFLTTGLGLAAIIWAALPLAGCEGQLINLAMPPASERQILPNRSIKQTFVAAENGLNRIDVFVQSYFRRNTHPVTIKLMRIAPPGDSAAAAVTHFAGSFAPDQLPAQAWQSFTFAPVAQSAGRTFAIVLESPTAAPGNAITVGGLLNADPYPAGDAFVGATRLEGDIAFRACYPLTTGQKLRHLAGQLTQNRPGLWGVSAFYGGLGLWYGLLLAALFWRLARLALG